MTGAPIYSAMYKKPWLRIAVDRQKERMVLISFHAPQSYVETLDELVRMGVFPTRSEAIRAALRELLSKYKLDGGPL